MISKNEGLFYDNEHSVILSTHVVYVNNEEIEINFKVGDRLRLLSNREDYKTKIFEVIEKKLRAYLNTHFNQIKTIQEEIYSDFIKNIKQLHLMKDSCEYIDKNNLFVSYKLREDVELDINDLKFDLLTLLVHYYHSK